MKSFCAGFVEFVWLKLAQCMASSHVRWINTLQHSVIVVKNNLGFYGFITFRISHHCFISSHNPISQQRANNSKWNEFLMESVEVKVSLMSELANFTKNAKNKHFTSRECSPFSVLFTRQCFQVKTLTLRSAWGGVLRGHCDQYHWKHNFF